ncbi:aminoglycoside phosphotransferase family protein [Caldibacillus lycopersici]|uniref:Aminoglycoside phosphotransferase family protein n=1 Tax=Perspicuibacillus lycopersici TaxID=1325689 RepID=A0AAE3IXB2_9BACI|nr:aminoglycoside phosphotransferase family protein [Perspicuibacillus lycopersici]MCU9614624.1 aminoglycoside phosphotransferase family protein [Perspicuibacillus lycopersici]
MLKLTEIPNSERWRKIEHVHKGWSNDEKYFVVDEQGNRLLLRIAEARVKNSKQAELEMIRLCNQFTFPMSRVIDFGTCQNEDYVYMLLTWVDGAPLEDCIHSLSETKQYELGIEAGSYLKQIHSLPVTKDVSDWEKKMQQKIMKRIEEYVYSPYTVEGDAVVVDFVTEHLHLLKGVRKVYQHGDFHIGNLVYTVDRKIGVIDFNRCDIGDYVEEFYKVQQFDREVSIPFARGKIDGYFGGTPTLAFWQRQALYVAYASLYSILWSVPFGEKSVAEMVDRFQLVRKDYQDFQTVIPLWYA